jgi:hypothetical protein
MCRNRLKLIGTASTQTVKIRFWIGSALWFAIAAPPAASFLLLLWVLLAAWTTPPTPSDLAYYLIAFLFFAAPVGYVFGVIPAFLAGVTYSAALTAIPPSRAHWLLRVCVGAVAGGFWSGLWFCGVVGASSPAYALTAALVMALLALRRPLSRAMWLPRRSRIATDDGHCQTREARALTARSKAAARDELACSMRP